MCTHTTKTLQNIAGFFVIYICPPFEKEGWCGSTGGFLKLIFCLTNPSSGACPGKTPGASPFMKGRQKYLVTLF